jgi:Rieske Fe-S protein
MNAEASTGKSRRRFLKLLGALGLGWLVAAVYPAYRYLGPQTPPDPFGEDGLAPVQKITPADVARPGMGKNGAYGTRGVVVFRDQNGQLKAFDSKCTHAGCNVAFEGDRIYCNCHGGTYDLNGVNVAGPPPRPLTRLGITEQDGVLYVSRIENTGGREAKA